jgi:hypothetical protein
MKKAILILLLPLCFHAKAQQADEENKDVKKGFQKERLFTGGNLNLGFSSYYTSLGITPQFGYSLTDWADAGVTINLNYTSQRDQFSTAKIRQTVYGPGAFVRLFPVRFLFAGAQYEYNILHQKTIPADSGFPVPDFNTSANSLLVGGGYAGGREKGNNSYYYISVMWDIMGDKNSPYIDEFDRSIPVIRAGYNIGLFQGRNKKF